MGAKGRMRPFARSCMHDLDGPHMCGPRRGRIQASAGAGGRTEGVVCVFVGRFAAAVYERNGPAELVCEVGASGIACG